MSIDILPLSGTLGAEIFGLDLQSGLSNAEFDRVHKAFLDYKVIVMRGQKGLQPDQHKAFARRFGTLNIHPYVKGMKDHEIIKEKEDKVNFGGGWHTDMSFEETPALGSILHAIELPPYGGDTLFADQQAAYDALSPGLKATLAGLKAVHSASREYSTHGTSAQKRQSMETSEAEDAPEYEHPVIRTHPETGRKGLYVNPAFTLPLRRLVHAREQAATRLPVQLVPRGTLHLPCRWQAGDVTMWTIAAPGTMR